MLGRGLHEPEFLEQTLYIMIVSCLQCKAALTKVQIVDVKEFNNSCCELQQCKKECQAKQVCSSMLVVRGHTINVHRNVGISRHASMVALLALRLAIQPCGYAHSDYTTCQRAASRIQVSEPATLDSSSTSKKSL